MSRAPKETCSTLAAQRRSPSRIAQLIIARTASPSPITYLPYDVAYEVGFEDMARRVPDVEKISQLTGWRSQRNLAQVLDDVIAEVRSERVAYAVTGDE